MQTIGLLGGMSWESTELYYRWINEWVKEKLGGLHSAKIVLVSVDFQEIETLQHEGRWDEAGAALAGAGQQIEAAGADFLLICTNTMHKVAPQIEAAIRIPILHLADATAVHIQQHGLKKVGLLGTSFTMEQDFYRGRLEQHGLEVIIPPAADRAIVHGVIYNELCLGQVQDASRQAFLRIIDDLHARGPRASSKAAPKLCCLFSSSTRLYPCSTQTAIHAATAVNHTWELNK